MAASPRPTPDASPFLRGRKPGARDANPFLKGRGELRDQPARGLHRATGPKGQLLLSTGPPAGGRSPAQFPAPLTARKPGARGASPLFKGRPHRAAGARPAPHTMNRTARTPPGRTPHMPDTTPGGPLAAFISGLPKAELHVHHVGSASPRIVAELAARHPDSAVPQDPAALVDYFTFRDFAHFIEVYLSVVDLIRDAEDVRLLTFEVARDMARQNIRYAELTVTPYSSTRRGIPGEAFMEAIEDARKSAEAELGVTLRWCFDIPGEAGLASAEETARLALDLQPDGLVSFGLGGPEIGVPRPQFKPYFDQARAAGLHSVPHAGETTGPQTVWDAIHELGAERIGHGTSSVRDPRLLAYLAEHRIPLEVCPTSNIATRAVATLEEHPIREMAAAGVLVTVNSDDPPMFGTDLNTEYGVAARLLGLDTAGVAALARNAVDASFMDAAGKARLTAEIDAYTAARA
jgi:aminodeoxyfutalosine deaminase